MAEQMHDVNEYARSLIEAVLEFTGTQDKLTTIVCMTCGENFTSSFPDVNGTVPCGNSRMWEWAYPYGGDIYVYISCYKYSKEYSQQTMDQSMILELTTAMTDKLSESNPEPALNAYLYKTVIAIWGSKAVTVIRDLHDRA
ncbi:uncharacterized protein N7511_011274 [Penicillium nucicola]|uniref:uncharacterized protein n=1 Tax=Penicillium nucicola TaxID=1850975 RepID=UPI0025455B67|nr:uncharacterized protein N7511_011274 [Penicillium nucicola]KAJ5742542.1 hypothetical protein N7511_011274 [Penicillium nucicola]